MPQHVVPIGMRGEACHDGLAQLAKVVREGRHFAAGDARVDEQHTVRALDDSAIALDELALVNQKTGFRQAQPTGIRWLLPARVVTLFDQAGIEQGCESLDLRSQVGYLSAKGGIRSFRFVGHLDRDGLNEP